MTSSLKAQAQDLLQRAAATDSLSHRDHDRMHNLLAERREALLLVAKLEVKSEAQKKEFVSLVSRVSEIAGLAVRGPNGHAWMQDFPNRENASQFYQALRALVKWITGRIEASQ